MEETESVFIHSEALEGYHYPPECPLSSQRAARTAEILKSMDLLEGPGRAVLAPQPAGMDALLKFHEDDYLQMLQKASAGVFDEGFIYKGLGTPDCPLFAGLFDYAALAAGASLAGADLLLSGKARTMFNPSGGYHHAAPGHCSGFCYINDVVLACMRLAEAGKRVLFLDVDAHHGDGVQNAFYARNDVLTVSFHESGKTLYPGTGFEDEIGDGEGKGFCINLPLPVGTYDGIYLHAFGELVLPILEGFRPDAIVLEIGMDGLSGDPLAHLNLTNNAYADLIGLLKERDLPLLATGGGGYHTENTARGWALCWTVLSGAEPDEELSFGMGGVMLQSSEWVGGLRDRVLLTHGGQRKSIDAQVQASISQIKKTVFPILGLG